MKRILCYGDSNTWGYDQVTHDRFDKQERWTDQLSRALGSNYTIIEEGLNGAPQILLIAPPAVGKLTAFAEMFEEAETKSRKLAEHYRRVAAEMGCPFLDASTVVTSSDLDGIHFEQSEHAKLGQAVAIMVKEIIG
jgi:lysophospholipase L1-like esterase